jgi:FkbM family methyltransferase
VIDVGVGEGTPDLYRCFPDARYLLVDANPASADALSALASKLDAATELVFCGREPGSVKLKVYAEASKSSRYASARELSLEREVLVPVQTLDTLVEKHQLARPHLLKIDVEGAELEVLQGAALTLRSTDAVIAEASIAPRFHGGTSFEELVAILSAHGFAAFDFLDCFDYPEPGRLYQADVVFVRSDATFRTI